MKTNDNKKIFEVDGNKLVVDLDTNKYYIIFENYDEKEIISEIPKEVFSIYIESKRKYKRNQNEEERHWERVNLSEIELYNRANNVPKSVEATVIENEKKHNLHIAISSIPEIQKKRIIMKFFDEMTERELAEKEEISIRAIQYSLRCGIENLKNFKKFLK